MNKLFYKNNNNYYKKKNLKKQKLKIKDIKINKNLRFGINSKIKKNKFKYKKKCINTSLNIFFYYKIIERNIININKLKREYKFSYINFNNIYFFKIIIY